MLMDLLVLLAEQAGQVVGKNEILERLRDSQFVSESALTSDIAELRRLLGDSGTSKPYQSMGIVSLPPSSGPRDPNRDSRCSYLRI
jgi:DNA-binding winged helix-turn-helix (wHTH) protein